MDVCVYIGTFLAPIFYKLFYMSMVGTILGGFILILIAIFDGKLSAKWKCFMWFIPIIFLMIPISRISIQTEQDFLFTSLISKMESSVQSVPQSSISKEENEKYESETIGKELKVQKEEMQIYNTPKEILLNVFLPSIWILGTGISLALVILGNVRLRNIVRSTKKVEDCQIKMLLMRCRRKLSIHKKIEICLQNGNASPCIYGILRPKIFVSEGFLEQNENVIENVFMHELSHYKRKDVLTNYILLIMTCLHWFNPFVYYFFKKMRQEMELATDEIALSGMGKEEKKQYGHTLIKLLQTFETPKVASKMLGMTDDSKNMERRIKMIKNSDRKIQKIIIGGFTFVLVFMIALPFVVQAVERKR